MSENPDDNDEGEAGWKPVTVLEDEGREIWAKVMVKIKESETCFYLGRGHGRTPDLENFVGALPLIGDCNALVFAEPHRTKLETWRTIEERKGNLIYLPEGNIANIVEIETAGDLPQVDRESLFGEPPLQWIPPEVRPRDDNLWGISALLWIESADGARQIRLLCIGIGGLAAWLYFFRHHGIQPTRIIGNPF